MADIFRKMMDKVGKGGVKCYCCNDWHGRERKGLNRIIRHRIKNSDRINFKKVE